jgi:hypothetical protein
MRYVVVTAVLCLVVPQTFGQEEEGKELEEMKGVVEGLSESFTEYRNYVDVLRKIKISGLIHAQYRYADLEGTAASYSGGSFPRNVKGQFELRRGRLKIRMKICLRSSSSRSTADSPELL